MRSGRGAILALWSILLLSACDRREERSPSSTPTESTARLVVDGAHDQVGFARAITLTAKVEQADPASAWQVRWEQVWGPKPAQMSVNGDTLSVRTPDAPDGAFLADYAGRIIPLSAAATGRMVFRVTAESGTQRLETTIEVTAAYPSAGWPRAAVGIDAYVATFRPGDLESLEPSGLRVFPSPVPHLTRVRASESRWYDVRHPSEASWSMRAGTWLGSNDCGRVECHPVEYQRWEKTRHSSIFRRGVRGELDRARGRYEEACVSCHTVGDQPAAGNDGFDDRVRASRWEFPSRPSASAWTAVPEAVRERANVQCESCHGAGWFYVGYGDDICAQCHDHAPEYPIVAQSHRTRMARSQESVANRSAKSEVCAQCHIGSGYLASLRGHRSGSKAQRELETEPHGVTCAICHEPHGTACDRQLRLCGFVEVPGETFDAGQGALCISCHNGEANVVDGPLLRPFVPGADARAGRGHSPAEAMAPRETSAAPHAPQLQVLTGRGGRFLALPKTFARSPAYPHMGVPDSCVGCHYDRATRKQEDRGHTFRMVANPQPTKRPACAREISFRAEREAPSAPSCERCHGAGDKLDRTARGDYDGDGKVAGIATEVDGLLALLRAEIERGLGAMESEAEEGARGVTFAIDDETIVLAGDDCRPLRDKKGAGIPLPESAALLRKAAYNFMLVARDGSAGIHNPQYVVRLLQSTVEELEVSRGERPRHRWKRLQ